MVGYFYPRSPCGERPALCQVIPPKLYFYPRSPCGERRPTMQRALGVFSISIHALLAESDGGPGLGRFEQRDFYPRSPCGERQLMVKGTDLSILFLSTLSLRRATPGPTPYRSRGRFLSTLSLRRATVPQQENGQAATISIHALLAESDRSPE